MKYLGRSVDEKKLAASQWDSTEENLPKRYLDGKEICFPVKIE
jgi:hypothetical protein